MSGRGFVDTNVLIYAFSDDVFKQRRAEKVLIASSGEERVISTQVVGEFVNVCLRRGLLDRAALLDLLDVFGKVFEIVRPSMNTLRAGLRIQERYGFSWWDSVLIATALEAGCSVFYTEDLQASQMIDDALRIVDPFRD